jgi:regulation of enolase protein 1 (concanavalin A-like superfamily)
METGMTAVSWDAGTWTNGPVSSQVRGDSLVVEAVEGSDYWEKTVYGFEHRNGHALLTPWTAEAAVEVSFSLAGFDHLYDQAGIMLWQDDEHWIKAGVELNDGVPHLAVVVTDGFSDWSLSPVPDWVGHDVTVRASRLGDGVVIRARVDGESWRTIRVARFDPAAAAQAGPMLCSPTRAGLRVTFTRWVEAEPDADLHTDPGQ